MFYTAYTVARVVLSRMWVPVESSDACTIVSTPWLEEEYNTKFACKTLKAHELRYKNGYPIKARKLSIKFEMEVGKASGQI